MTPIQLAVAIVVATVLCVPADVAAQGTNPLTAGPVHGNQQLRHAKRGQDSGQPVFVPGDARGPDDCAIERAGSVSEVGQRILAVERIEVVARSMMDAAVETTSR
jgi:hypothetical protein